MSPEKKRSRVDDHVDEATHNTNKSAPPPFVRLPMYGEHKRAVSSVKLAPFRLTKNRSNGAPICASASSDGSVKIWDLAGSAAAAATASGGAEESSRAEGGESISTTSNSATAAQSDPNRYLLQPTQTLVGHARGINDVCWSPDAPMVATASDDKTLRLWDATTGDALVEFRGHDNFVFCTQMYQNLLVSGSFDETVKLWDCRSGECVSTLPVHSDPVTAVSFNRDGTCLVSASHDGLIRIWDVATGECLKTIFAAGALFGY